MAMTTNAAYQLGRSARVVTLGPLYNHTKFFLTGSRGRVVEEVGEGVDQAHGARGSTRMITAKARRLDN